MDLSLEQTDRKQNIVLENCSPQGSTHLYWRRTARSGPHTPWLTISTGVVNGIHFYILVGQDNDYTHAEIMFLWDIYTFYTCSKNTIKIKTILLCTTQFRLQIEILVTYPRNKMNFLTQNRTANVFYWWSGNELTFLLLKYLQWLLSPWGVCELYFIEIQFTQR